MKNEILDRANHLRSNLLLLTEQREKVVGILEKRPLSDTIDEDRPIVVHTNTWEHTSGHIAISKMVVDPHEFLQSYIENMDIIIAELQKEFDSL